MPREEYGQRLDLVGRDQDVAKRRADRVEIGLEQEARSSGVIIADLWLHQRFEESASIGFGARERNFAFIGVAADVDETPAAHDTGLLKRDSRASSRASAAFFFSSINASARA